MGEIVRLGHLIMSIHRVNVFISHSWRHSGHYDTLESWIFNEKWNVGAASLDLHDFSVPKNYPIKSFDSDKELRESIYAKISRSHVVVIPTGMYSSYSTWIQKEIEGAQAYNKPILAVNPWGQERKSSVVLMNSTDNCGWNKQSVINKIWQLYYANEN